LDFIRETHVGEDRRNTVFRRKVVFLEYFLILLALAMFIFSFWILLPASMYSFWPMPKSFFHKNPALVLNRKLDQEIQEFSKIIESINFVKIGIKVEKPHLWRKAQREISLASQQNQTFASIFTQNNKVYYYFYTPFTDGHVVLTANGVFPAITTDNLLQSAVAGSEPVDLMEIHKKQVEQFIMKGSRPFNIFDQESRIKATYQYYELPIIRNKIRKIGLTSLAFFLIGCYPFFDILRSIIFEA
jgi:hypothetical protein